MRTQNPHLQGKYSGAKIGFLSSFVMLRKAFLQSKLRIFSLTGAKQILDALANNASFLYFSDPTLL